VILKVYLLSMTGYSNSHLKSLIAKKLNHGKLYQQVPRRNKFKTVYTPEDIQLLVNTDNAHDRLSGPATKRILVRAWEVFRKFLNPRAGRLPGAVPFRHS
jgi:hypothetical protein